MVGVLCSGNLLSCYSLVSELSTSVSCGGVSTSRNLVPSSNRVSCCSSLQDLPRETLYFDENLTSSG